ncbi:MAG: ABC transporter substrate-binding protein [Candidatus Lambdaproteobacteria bacterium]|nr:ABC transporter substrate-binding protein [Candidatus Lambdaproteobacteria bacterium]
MTLLLVAGVFGTNASANEYTIGLMCDRSGVTGTIGNLICPGFHDYIRLFNKQNRLPGHTLKVMEIDHGYNVPRGVEAYERFKAAGVMTIALYGTPHTVALTPKLSEDHILGTSPGFGSAAGANGERFPYLFPAAASYWSQVASAVQFIQNNWKGSTQPKIAYIYYDNPAGREPLTIIGDLQKQLGFELQTYAVPAPGIEMRPQVLDITRKFKADWVVAHFFGQTGVALKEFSRMGHPREQMIGLVWAGGESDMKVAGWDKADGYYTVQMAHVGKDHPVNQEIVAMYKAEGKAPPEEMELSVYYNRGVSWAALHSEAIRATVESKGPNITPADVKNAMERINGYSERNFMPPFKMSPQDHEGGGYVRIFQVHDGGFRAASDWMQGYRDVVMKHVVSGE